MKKFDASALSDQGREAFKTLTDIELFAIGPVGFSGGLSSGEGALSVLIKENAAESALRALIDSATSEGGLYALVGLKKLNHPSFLVEYERFRLLTEPPERTSRSVKVREGNVLRQIACNLFTAERLKVAESIADKALDNEQKNTD